MDHSQQPPKPTKGDALLTAARAGLGMIPVFGAPAAELFTAIVTPPLEKRRESWRIQVGERISALETAGFFTADDLQSNEAFISAVTRASQLAMETHEQEKLGWLANASLNAAIDEGLDESKRQMFLRFVGELSVWHIRILRHLQGGPHARSIEMAGSLMFIVREVFVELKSETALVNAIHADLTTRALIGANSLSSNLTPTGRNGKFTTDFGDQFLAFLSDPLGR